MHTAGLPVAVVNLSLICALTSLELKTLGSLMKAWPLRQLGGRSPVVPIFRHSIVVVLPEPFLPTMSVSGLKNSMTWVSLGEKDRIPRIDILSIDVIGRAWRDVCPYASGGRKPGADDREGD